MSDISFSARAYCKIILHAAKYPHCPVNGVLLSTASSKGKEIKFVDAVPLFHITLNLTPMAEIALMQIDEYASRKNLIISGFYSANENVHVNSFEKAYNRISDKIATNFPSACFVLVDNTNLSLDMDGISLKVAQFTDGNYKTIDTNCIFLNPNNTLDVCSQLLEKNSHTMLVDFDNHLDNLQLDWHNDELDKEIESVLSECN